MFAKDFMIFTGALCIPIVMIIHLKFLETPKIPDLFFVFYVCLLLFEFPLYCFLLMLA